MLAGSVAVRLETERKCSPVFCLFPASRTGRHRRPEQTGYSPCPSPHSPRGKYVFLFDAPRYSLPEPIVRRTFLHPNVGLRYPCRFENCLLLSYVPLLPPKRPKTERSIRWKKDRRGQPIPSTRSCFSRHWANEISLTLR